jgi:hypothetical protein
VVRRACSAARALSVAAQPVRQHRRCDIDRRRRRAEQRLRRRRRRVGHVGNVVVIVGDRRSLLVAVLAPAARVALAVDDKGVVVVRNDDIFDELDEHVVPRAFR